MSEKVLQPCMTHLSGIIAVPGDKSISHRSIILGSLAEGTTKVAHFLESEDCLRTIDAFRSMGVSIEKKGDELLIHGKGIRTLHEPLEPLYFGNSGTTARLMFGVLAGLPFFTTVYGDPSLTKRPMDRVVLPLRKMGAAIEGREQGGYLPISVNGGGLAGISYTLPVKSAQVKSAILLAGLFADGTTEVIEQTGTRDHTENMLEAFGADIQKANGKITITNKKGLKGSDIQVPGDISSASFFLAAAAIVPDSKLTLKNVGLNPSRTGILDVLEAMGAELVIENEKVVSGELIGDITISNSCLKGTVIKGEIIPRLIDEIPIIALLATQAEGTTIVKDAEELHFKETDRILAVADVLSKLGADIEATDDGLVIHGKTPLTGGSVSAYDDHRIAMMIVIASLMANENVTIDDISSIAISYPEFFADLKQIIA